MNTQYIAMLALCALICKAENMAVELMEPPPEICFEAEPEITAHEEEFFKEYEREEEEVEAEIPHSEEEPE